jgi:hypothetical protein
MVLAMGFKLLKFKSKDEGEGSLKRNQLFETIAYTSLITKPYPLICPWSRKKWKVRTYLCCRCT